ncbi:MAG: helix-turn-helix transcriptional regulator, partial [Hyphomicrobiales bacterium]|nr:helix-turn-helix transcriptional regulator [Hyphomicrobiales bacterium]
MKKTTVEQSSYHHGDLRAALVAEGMRQLGGEGAGDLSLRGVARAVGVSATAVYRHFPDKDALLSAIAEEGFRLLGQAQRAA